MGAGGRLFGIVTEPAEPPAGRELPMFVFLSAGLLHRVGPGRLHVRLARELAERGACSLRVDLAGKGDSPAREGMTNQESVGRDYDEIKTYITQARGRKPLVLFGLCSGADNAIRLAINDADVVGMVLLDPVCPKDDGFARREKMQKYSHPRRWWNWMKRRVSLRLQGTGRGGNQRAIPDPLQLRDIPSEEQTRTAFSSVQARGGSVFSAFSSYALIYYNKIGQFGDALGLEGYSDCCTERFWPAAEHTYATELHRRRLIEEVLSWFDSAYGNRPVAEFTRGSGTA